MKNLRNDRNPSDMDGAPISCDIDTDIVVPPLGCWEPTIPEFVGLL